MDEQTAWELFAKSGSVSDYLAYSRYKHSGRIGEYGEEAALWELPPEEEQADAYRDGWISDRGENGR